MALTMRDGALHVDVADWAALIGQPTPDEMLATARQVPGGEHALAAVAAPRAVIQLETASPAGVRNHEAWLGDDAAAVLIHVHDGTQRRVLPLPHDHVTVALARLTGLGPRDQVRPGVDRRAREVDGAALDAWFSPDDATRRAAWAPFGADRAWRLVADAVGVDAEPLTLVAADGIDGGCWLLERADGRLVATPITPTALFQQLAAVMPLLWQDLEGAVRS